MAKVVMLTDELRGEVETLIRNIENHGCGFGYDAQAQSPLRTLLDAIVKGQEIINRRPDEAPGQRFRFEPRWVIPGGPWMA